MNLLKLNNVRYKPESSSFLRNDERDFELTNISFEIEEKKATAIVGESGSGKTTLGKILAGLIKPGAGNIEYNLPRRTGVKPIQFLFQNNSELINPYRKIKDYLIYPNIEIAEVEKILTLFNLSGNILTKKAGNLSGGERQRVALARLILAKPSILILDEPFSAQDISSQLNIKKILQEIRKEYNLTMVIISHSFEILNELADDILVMYGGRIIESGNFEEIISSPLHPYTHFLLKAANFKLAKNGLKNVDKPGEINECLYFNNCPIRIDLCKKKVNEYNKGNHTVYCNKPGEF